MAVSEEKKTEYYAALGKAIASWQSVEHTFAATYELLLNAEHFSAGLVIMEAIISFRDKMLVFDATLRLVIKTSFVDVVSKQAVYDDSLHKEWSKLRQKIERLSRKRNRIAHALTTIVGSELRAGPTWSKQTYFGNPFEDPERWYNAHQLLRLKAVFDLLGQAILAFAFKIKAHKK